MSLLERNSLVEVAAGFGLVGLQVRPVENVASARLLRPQGHEPHLCWRHRVAEMAHPTAERPSRYEPTSRFVLFVPSGEIALNSCVALSACLCAKAFRRRSQPRHTCSKSAGAGLEPDAGDGRQPARRSGAGTPATRITRDHQG